MSQYKISKKRLKHGVNEEYDAAMLRTDEGHGAFGNANRDEDDEPKSKKKKKDERTDEAHCATNRDADLDPVGNEDGDIDNDGDKDKTDKYLLNRRKAIAKAMNKESLDSIRTLIQQELKNL